MSTSASALSREARKAETRRALLDAAAELFANHGIEATSLDEIAKHVGLTKGAVYAHFDSKAELVEEVLEEASAVVDPDELLDARLSLEERLSLLGTAAAELIPHISKRSIMLHFEYFLYVLRDQSRLRRSVRERRRDRETSGAILEAAERERGATLPLPGHELSALLEAVGNGLVIELARDPEAISAETIRLFLAAFGRGLDTYRESAR